MALRGPTSCSQTPTDELDLPSTSSSWARSRERPGATTVAPLHRGHEQWPPVNQAMRCLRGLVSEFFERVHEANPRPPLRARRGVAARHRGRPIPARLRSLPLVGRPGLAVRRRGRAVDARLRRASSTAWSSPASEGGAIGARSSPSATRSSWSSSTSSSREIDAARRAQVRRDADLRRPTGQQHPLLAPFGDRLFAFEHRNWEAIDLDERALARARRQAPRARAATASPRAAPSSGSRSRPASRPCSSTPRPIAPASMNWVARPEQAAAFKATYGEVTYQAMLRTLDDPRRLARTFALVIPGGSAATSTRSPAIAATTSSRRSDDNPPTRFGGSERRRRIDGRPASGLRTPSSASRPSSERARPDAEPGPSRAATARRP